jgi:hypothetical protein
MSKELKHTKVLKEGIAILQFNENVLFKLVQTTEAFDYQPVECINSILEWAHCVCYNKGFIQIKHYTQTFEI